MALFVINEWIWHDVAGQNEVSGPRQQQAFDFIVKLTASDHQIVVVQGSAFDEKLKDNYYSNRALPRRIARIFFADVRDNLDRCLVRKSDDIPALSEELAASIKQKDHYLLQAQLSAPGSIIVTTDAPLCQRVRQAGLPCLSREEFLRTYFEI